MKAVSELTDDELAQEIMDQVRTSRATGKHDRERTRAISAEAAKRGWNLRKPTPPAP